jgi:hypothetical protein
LFLIASTNSYRFAERIFPLERKRFSHRRSCEQESLRFDGAGRGYLPMS